MYKRHIILVTLVVLIIWYIHFLEANKPKEIIKKPDNTIQAIDLGSVYKAKIKDCDTFLKYKYVLESYFPGGYEIDINSELKYKGEELPGSSQYDDVDYKCCLLYYKTRNSSSGERKMLIPITKMSDYWMNEILWNEIHDNISYILTGIDNDIIKIDTQAYRDNKNILKNEFKITLNNFTLEQLQKCETIIYIYVRNKNQEECETLNKKLNNIKLREHLDNITFKVLKY